MACRTRLRHEKNLEENKDKINWDMLSSNPGIFEIDYGKLKERIEPFVEDLMKICYHPKRLTYYLEKYNYDIGEDMFLEEE